MTNCQPTVYFRSVTVQVDRRRTRLPTLFANPDVVVLGLVDLDSMPAKLEPRREIDVAFFAAPVLVRQHVDVHVDDQDSADFALLLRRFPGQQRTFLQRKTREKAVTADHEGAKKAPRQRKRNKAETKRTDVLMWV
jgi:hypothetical protein